MSKRSDLEAHRLRGYRLYDSPRAKLRRLVARMRGVKVMERDEWRKMVDFAVGAVARLHE